MSRDPADYVDHIRESIHLPALKPPTLRALRPTFVSERAGATIRQGKPPWLYASRPWPATMRQRVPRCHRFVAYVSVFALKRSIAIVPRIGPIASAANAYCHPTRATSGGIMRIEIVVIRKPMHVWIVSAVPT